MRKSDPQHPHRLAQKAAIREKNNVFFRTALLPFCRRILGGVCAEDECDRTDDLHFAHIDPATKLFNVADSSNAQIDFVRVVKEAQKCRLLCYPHHDEDTKKQHASGEIRANKGRRKDTGPLLGILKTCCFCKEAKDVSLFSPGSGSHKRQSACRDCLRNNTNARHAVSRAYIDDLKKNGVGCVVCGSKVGLDFDHVPSRGEKFKEVSKMLGYARERIDEEIAKCDLVCRKHHKKRTAQRKTKKEAP